MRNGTLMGLECIASGHRYESIVPCGISHLRKYVGDVGFVEG